ncbi:hypothetical protein ZIOFF_019544 [Zingiber officinale]|uniref:Uncharacterized protein n=1 Tax=Zingiber officinale TaxID=94328 RepID=A0A8J5LN09_ZINOF|nr:hypothetical protein ZIOFF_019544 [Zingiber officinale]
MKKHLVTAIYTLYQKLWKALEFHPSRCGFSVDAIVDGTSSSVDAMVDGMVIFTGSAKQRKIVRLKVARDVLQKLCMEAISFEDDDFYDGRNLQKQKKRLSDYCDKRRWMKPSHCNRKAKRARDAMPKLSGVEAVSFQDNDVDDGQNLHKQRLYVYCDKRR